MYQKLFTLALVYYIIKVVKVTLVTLDTKKRGEEYDFWLCEGFNRKSKTRKTDR